MLHEVLGALVGVFLGVGHGVVGERVDDGDPGVLNRPPLTVVLSMAKENIMSNQILAQRDIPICSFSNIIIPSCLFTFLSALAHVTTLSFCDGFCR